MRVLLLYANPNQSTPVSPYGLDAIRGTVESHGLAVEMRTVNPFIEDLDPASFLAEVLAEFDPDLVGISIRNIDNAIVVLSEVDPPTRSPVDIVAYAPAVRELVRVVKTWNPEVPCVAGGAGFTSCPAEFLDYLGLDFGLVGAAELSFAQLVDAVSSAKPPHHRHVAEVLPGLPGAVYRGRGRFHLVPPTSSLATEPKYAPHIAPEYELLYRLHRTPVAVRTKIGCPLRCSYCTDPINMRRTNERPIDNVLDDIAHYLDVYGLTTFHIADAELNLPYETQVSQLCRGIKNRGLSDRIRWRGYFNVIPFSDELVDAVVESGCRTPSFAVDSFDREGLKGHRKNFRERHVHDVLSRFLARGTEVVPEICLLFGQPGETLQSINTNIRWMLHYADRGARIAYSCGLRVYPNTPLAVMALQTRHLYVPPGVRGWSRAHTVRFEARELIEPVVYCEPLPPRDLAAYVAERVGRHPGIAPFVDGRWPEARHADALRSFNVGVHRLAHGKLGEAAAHLEHALSRHPGLTVARTALKCMDSVLTGAEGR